MSRPTVDNPGYVGPGVYMVEVADQERRVVEARMYVEPIAGDDWREGWLRFSDDETRAGRGSWDVNPRSIHLMTMRKVDDL